MTYPIHTEPPFWAAVIGESRKTSSLAEQLRSVQTSYWLFFNSSSNSMDTMREAILFMDPLRLFLLDQGFPVEYELDKFNTPYTETTLHPHQNWLCRLRCRISLRHLATTSPLGNIFWRQSRFSPKQPEPQTHGDFNFSLLKQQTRLLLYYGEHISLARPTTHTAFSALSQLQIVHLLLSFLRDLQDKSKLFIPCCH